MNEIKMKYSAGFSRIGKEQLLQQWVCFTPFTRTGKESVHIMLELIKDACGYILFFSTHHHDYLDSVKVYRSAGQIIQNDQHVLPPASTNSVYGYTDEEIGDGQRISAV